MAEIDATPVPDYAARFRADGKVFVVLGAGNGIGRQSAHALAQLGARIVCVGRSEAPTRRVAEEVGGAAMLADATRSADIDRILDDTWELHGRLDGIVDIIALQQPVRFEELTDHHWDQQLRNVLLHAFYALQKGSTYIERSGGGSICLVGSIGGERSTGAPLQFHYGVMKAALHHMTRLGGTTLGSRNVRVNCVVPGLTATPRIVERFGEERLAQMLRSYPLGRLPDACDIAGAIAYLVSDLARNVTSEVFVVDGGHSVQAAAPISPLDALFG